MRHYCGLHAATCPVAAPQPTDRMQGRSREP